MCISRSQPDSSPQEAPKSVQKTLNILPNPSQTLPKSTQDRSPSPFGAHLAPMLEKRSIWNAPKAARKHPKAPKRRPRPSQTLPKWIHRPPQTHFFYNLRFFFSHWKIASILYQFFRSFYGIFKNSTLTKHCVGARILKIGAFKKNTKNPRKILLKSFQNRVKIDPKSIQNQRKSIKNATII